MNASLQVALWLRLHGNDAAAAGLRRFTDSARKGFGQVSDSVKQAWRDLNGFSTATRLLAMAGGLGLVKRAIEANLEFEKKLLEMKQLAEMTQDQAMAMRKAAVERATDLLATPSDIAEGMRTLANAGMKYEAIAGTIEEAARAALAFRSTISDIANMDFDIQQKFQVDPSRMAAMHDMLYYHSKQGRFEAKSLSTYAPEYLNEMARVGMGGETALNFAGALTQVMQKIKPATQPGEVSTLIKHGLGHITDKMYVQHIKAATGIDVEQFMPEGRFYGEGGVQGMLDLAKALKAKGLDNPFKMSQAGFRDQYTRDFWLQMMRSIDEIEEQMRAARGAAGSQTLNRDVEEIRRSNFGRVLKGRIQVEKGALGEGVTQGADFAGRMAETFADHPGQVMAAGAGVAGLWLAGRYARNRQARIAQQGTAGGLPGAGGLGGVQQVFVTNWPVAMGGQAGTAGMPGPPGGMGPNDGPQRPQGKLARAAGAVGTGLGAIGAAASGWQIGYEMVGPAVNSAINALTAALTRKDQTLGEWIYDALHRKEQAELNKPIVVENKLVLDGAVVAASVNRVNARDAQRN
ncbi:phage tail tape measure protein [Accumulibacter sp.]|uniref:phage tail tape measure protein n=1 Tax=Accumulibacter sp. TaxID=2053492 RepID=UPI0025FF235B|nr:phage tail tape measure protein [Accumulibacter sp.]MCM8595130.1 phage tail tape measure protein [Accumulibacter sp.]MCM8625516.1 phage tail tape measure protein [Accumulibacter sp.]MDS4049276.1 phage tail tape measure protein [Accumulibacter sp.]